MTKIGPATTDRWAVSTRTDGEVLTAGVSLPSIELALLGIPQGFTPVEIQSWLRDLASVAIETSRSESGARPIPALLHHALTGLLFSQTELWSHTGQPLPCAAVFVDGPTGAAFGWVGRARVMILVNGQPFEPQWIIVRDELGQEAMAAVAPRDSNVLLTLEYWPQGEDGTQAPTAVDAEYGQSYADQVFPAPAAAPAEAPAPPAVERTPSPATAGALAPAPETLPTAQPGLAGDPTTASPGPGSVRAGPTGARHPSEGTFAMPRVPSPGAPSAAPPAAPPAAWRPPGETPPRAPEPMVVERRAPEPMVVERRTPEPTRAPEREALPPAPARAAARRPPAPEPVQEEEQQEESGHPVGRWLSRLMGLGRKKASPRPGAEPPLARRGPAPRGAGAGRPAAEGTPLSEGPRGPASADFDEPHALPSRGATPASAAVPRPRPAAPSPGGFETTGTGEFLGGAAAGEPRAPARPLEGLTALSASGPLAPLESQGVEPEPLATTPPYPVLDVPRPAGPPRGPIQIEREPVGADSTFAIPRLPSREPAKPARAPVVPAPPRPDSPHLVPPGARATEPAAPEPPEPPADFLAEFAASMQAPTAEPSPLVAPREPAEPAEPTRVPGPPTLRTPTPRPAPEPSPPVIPVARPQPPATRRVPAPPVAPVSRAAPVAPEPPPVAGPARTPVAPPPVEAEAPLPLPTPVLRSPSEQPPATIAPADAAALMRELPLPTPSAEMARPVLEPVDPDAVPEGMLVATPVAPGSGRRARRGAWPAPEELESEEPPAWRKPWVVLTFVAVLFGIGWFVGHSQAPDNDVHATPMSRLLRSIGLGGARFTASVDTDPPGAWINVDGKDLGRQTPATLELMPGEHQVALSIPDLGVVKVPVSGTRGQKVKVMEPLHGSLDVTANDRSLPVQLSLDGQAQGWLPAHIEKLPPGLHELQFSGPNMQPWVQTVSVRIREAATVVARPMMSPATGVVQVQASMNDDNGSSPLSGASIFVDGELRGTTPTSIELPRGPHSLRVAFGNETAPIQVIDLPGGNRRFANFQFGLDSDLPPLRLQGNYGIMPAKRVTTVSATLDGLDARDVRESWLHVRSPEGVWRRYEMTVEAGPRGAVLSVPFPQNMFDSGGHVLWYLSSATAQGDEFYTEMQHSSQ